jgi:transcriptional regulator with XRE-family HTH domain
LKILCAALPFGDRVVSIARSKYLPSRNRGIPISKEPVTVGEQLRKRRLELRILQAEAARRLAVSTVTLSRWECDRLYPTWPHWPRIAAYLGCNPFDDPALGRPKGNESLDVAFLLTNRPECFGARILKHRLEMKKSRKQFATELGVSVKSLWNWETNRRTPSPSLRTRIGEVLRIPRATGA